jgi:hypothetical protein
MNEMVGKGKIQLTKDALHRHRSDAVYGPHFLDLAHHD